MPDPSVQNIEEEADNSVAEGLDPR
jgi:hypothetical protein